LASDLVAAKNPLTPRVAVNRFWNYVFGQGLVATVDNFGHLGEEPSHPELLDWLASRFVRDGWSIKRTLRLLVTSHTFRLSHETTAAARERDPTNRWLARANVRRLEAESIRDALLAVVGRLDNKQFGPGVGAGEPRRSVYLSVRRNDPNPFLSAFDWPTTQSTEGRRNITNVPAQSLTLLNDRFVIDRARFWAERLIADSKLAEPAVRLRRMYLQAFGRPPNDTEVADMLAFAADLAREYQIAEKDVARDVRVWQDVAQTMFNLKEFIFLK
jgi:hypothetical protein